MKRGMMVGPYRILDRLGGGAMGDVHRAIDEALDREVALKVLRPELAHRPELVERFYAEARALAHLDHPHITRVHGMLTHEGAVCMVMEYIHGETMASRIARSGGLPWREAAESIQQILLALEYAHKAGMVHRDIKPANIMIGVTGHVTLMDFGIVRVMGTERSTRHGNLIGTLGYMSPEQIRGEEATHQSDLYAAGVVLYEAIAGSSVFSGTEFELMRQHVDVSPPSIRTRVADTPEWLDQIIERALAKNAAQRFPSARTFRDAIDRYLRVEPQPLLKETRLAPLAPPPAPPTRLADIPIVRRETATPVPAVSPPQRAGDWSWTNWRIWAGVAVASIAVVVTLVLTVGRGTPAAPVSTQTTAPTVADTAPIPSPARAPEPPVDAAPPADLPPPTRAIPPGTGPRIDLPRTPAEPPTLVNPTVPAVKMGKTFPVVNFDRVELAVEPAPGRETRPVRLRLDETRILVLDPAAAQALREIAYTDVQRTTYTPISSRRMVVRSIQHWVTIASAEPDLVLRLDKSDYDIILSEIAVRTGKSVQR